MLEARRLTHRYGDMLALDALSLRVSSGELCCLLGPNGAGKSTTIGCFLGFLRPTSGQALVADIDVAADPAAARARLAYIPENVMLYPYFSGRENLDYFSRLAGKRLSRDEQIALLESSGLSTNAVDRPVGGYSKGMRQKVGIAIALAKQAAALLLDEPTSGLDPRASNDFSKLLLELRGRGMAVLMATHDVFRARDVASTVGIMQEGRLRHLVEPSALSAHELEDLYLQTVAA